MTESSGLPPEQEAVRRLLADARHDGPPPPGVVSRLDDTLASLTAEMAEMAEPAGAGERTASTVDDSPGRIVDIGSRRRRVASIGLLAAASVVVAGVALGQVLPRGADDAADSSAGSQADSSLAEAPDSGGGVSDDSSSDQGGDAGAGAAETSPESLKSSPATPSPASPLAARPELSTVDVGLQDQVLALRAEASGARRSLASMDAWRDCGLPRPGRGRQLPAQVDGQAGAVVYRRPVGEAQRAELYVCGLPDPVRTFTLPAP